MKKLLIASMVSLVAASASASEWKSHGAEVTYIVPGTPSSKTAAQAKAELEQARADGTLARYQSLRNPPVWGVRNRDQLRADLHNRRPTVAATVSTGPRGAGLSVPRWQYGG